jgi:hypothetical protein
MMIEIGTGLIFKSGFSPFGVRCIEWSKDGHFIYLGTDQGRILVCECEDDIRENISETLELIRSNHFFWDKFGLGKE